MSGGFIDSATSAPYRNELSQPPDTPQIIARLTPKQEAKLRTHLDDRLASLERDERTFNLKSIPSLLSRLAPLLQLILQIPPYQPFSHIRTSYLLTLTAVIPSYIAALPLHQNGIGQREEGIATRKVLQDVLQFLGEVDRGWMAVLNRMGWTPPPSIISATKKAYEEGQVLVGGRAIRVEYGGQVDLTERIRLRSILVSGRSKIEAWARSYGSFPGSSFPASVPTAVPQGSMMDRTTGDADLGDSWETEILNIWNQTLEELAEGIDGCKQDV
ncbi:uncharacterized protein L203_105706 [Cryptococcus depauperatus CBS 7841]|uniref:Uncharacterized protein n=1 Tax=Cryptococcus depauperatus CBS 7841 TaxID=1295531 RepID=A0AAJ8JXY3_9TREE